MNWIEIIDSLGARHSINIDLITDFAENKVDNSCVIYYCAGSGEGQPYSNVGITYDELKEKIFNNSKNNT